MKIALASDHGGFQMKSFLLKSLPGCFKCVDFGTFHANIRVDYPDFVERAALAVQTGECERGIVVCFSGVGASIVANKVSSVRAALCWNQEGARLTRRHNDSNVLALGSAWTTFEDALSIVLTWLGEKFEGGRHENRIDKIRRMELSWARGECEK